MSSLWSVVAGHAQKHGFRTDRYGSDLEAGIVTEECWVSGVEIVPTFLRVEGTRLLGASVGQ